MPSKRTNDSVDRILEDLNMQQAEAGLRDSVTDRQVDDILRSVGISTTPAASMPQSGFSLGGADDLDALLNETRTPAAQPAPRPAPAPQRAYTPTQPAAQSVPRPAQQQPVQPVQQPVRPVQTTRPPQQTMPTQDTGTVTYDGDTTRTGIIKDFLLKMAPDGGAADTDALNQGKISSRNFSRTRWPSCPTKRAACRNPKRKSAACSA